MKHVVERVEIGTCAHGCHVRQEYQCSCGERIFYNSLDREENTLRVLEHVLVAEGLLEWERR